jgi:exopolysaccharide biosynthesis protein
MARLRSALVSAALLLLACSSAALAEWRIVSSERQGTGRAGVTHVVARAENETGARATLHFAVFNTKTATLRVIDDPPDKHAGLAETMQRENCIAGVNGGYFGPEGEAVGMLISDGRVVMAKQKARLLSGVLSVVNGRVQIHRAGEYAPKGKPSAARQCGPFLVDGAKAVPGLNDTRAARRTFVASNGAEQAAIGYSTHVTLAQLAQILATPGVAADLKIQRALNMDGGSSSGFWFKGEDGAPVSLREQKTVRDYLGIVPKS